MMNIAALAIMNKTIDSSFHHYKNIKKVGVKIPQFSFMQLEGSDPNLGVEMQSTGEVACFGDNFYEAFIKSLIAAGYVIPRKNGNVLVSVGGTDKKIETLPIIKKFNSLGFKIFATEHTADYLAKNGINSIALYKIGEIDRKPNLEDYLVKRELDLIINIPSKSTDNKMKDIVEDEYLIRRKAVEMGIPVFTTIEASKVFVDGLEWLENNGINIVEKINNK